MTKPDMKVFAKNLIDCIRQGAKYGIDVHGPISPDSQLQNSFCGVGNGDPIVTPEGHITTCVEVLEKDDPLADTFFIGSVSENKTDDGKQLVQISSEQVSRLAKRQIDYIPNCDSCFLKRQCAGGCPALSLRQEGGDIYTLDEEWCDAMREVNEATIRMRADSEIDPVFPSVRRQLSCSPV
jgi:radical SAM protein with 4Fe4S-binding SPASM domain